MGFRGHRPRMVGKYWTNPSFDMYSMYSVCFGVEAYGTF